MIICDWCKEEIESNIASTKFYAGLFYAGQETHLGPAKVNIRLDMHQTCANRMGAGLETEIKDIMKGAANARPEHPNNS